MLKVSWYMFIVCKLVELLLINSVYELQYGSKMRFLNWTIIMSSMHFLGFQLAKRTQMSTHQNSRPLNLWERMRSTWNFMYMMLLFLLVKALPLEDGHVFGHNFHIILFNTNSIQFCLESVKFFLCEKLNFLFDSHVIVDLSLFPWSVPATSKITNGWRV